MEDNRTQFAITMTRCVGLKDTRVKYPLRLVTALLCTALALAVDAWAQDRDPNPPQVSIEFFHPPSPIIQHETPRLAYEMRISNYAPVLYVLDSIDVGAGRKTFSFSGATLQAMMRFFGAKTPAATSRRIQPGASAIIYFMLGFDKPMHVPKTLEHTLQFTAPDGGHHALAARPLSVRQQGATVVGAPLRASDWLAGDSVHNGSGCGSPQDNPYGWRTALAGTTVCD